MNLLLLDDEPLELEQLEFLIHKHFPTWKVIKALNGTKALRLAAMYLERNQNFQLALVDIRIPGRDGLFIANRLKEMMPEIDIIVISAFQEFEYAKQSMYLKAVDYLVKPVLENELIQVLTNYVKDNNKTIFTSEIVQQAVAIIKSRYHKQLKLSEIADELFVNSSYLSRIFAEETNSTFSEFLVNYRIKMAKQLLVNKQLSIQYVSDVCGFSSQHYFSTSFKKITKLTPVQYRDSIK